MASTDQGTLQPIDITQLLKRSDIAFALGIMLILAVMIIPMPRWLLDLALSFSITFSVLILMTVLFIETPLDFSSFPTVILISTMIRLALNIASTRLILGNGHEGTGAAGDVIETFGKIIMGDNFIIGMIIFAILVIVNFIVITKGAGRIAEVSARFSLDAMPGKQMAIDADLSAGLISEDEARTRRKFIEDESSFFGAMDGAAKFVRGDAIAGLLITFINIVGGIIIGTFQFSLSLTEATETYTLLTVGDGLVTQIPALIVSTAAGLLVTKGSGTGKANRAIVNQFSKYPTALGLSAFLMLGMAALPGLPTVPFAFLGLLSGAGAWILFKNAHQEALIEHQKKLVPEESKEAEAEPIAKALEIDQVRLELGYGLLTLINDIEVGQRLTDHVKSLRSTLAMEMGFVMPALRIQDNINLPATTYVISVKEIEAARGEVRPNMLLVMDPKGEPVTLPGEATQEPTFGLDAHWVQPIHREEALFRGYTVVEPAAVVATHISEILKDNMPELLSYTETQKLIDELDKKQRKLVADLIPHHMTIATIQRVLQGLLAERVSIRDLATIVEAIAEIASTTKGVPLLVEHVRQRLARQISHEYVNEEGVLPVVTLSGEWEQEIHDHLRQSGDDVVLSLPPSRMQQLISDLRQKFDEFGPLSDVPVLLTSSYTRRHVRAIVERFQPTLVVMSQKEVHPKLRIKTMGQV